ncbi:MAG: type I-E CRISPR-associated protein Cas5/CasD [Verrucomicrobia bacterium]|nr:type I-E CRISPR-associated protein Cas5/CasD [Verrucomicrobiota bacterium]
MSESGFLALMLDAPLMSWGVSSRFQRRTTDLHPSRSAISGMICAAMGCEKGSEAEARALDCLEKTAFVYYAIPRASPRGDGRHLAIRRMEDFHTVSGTLNAQGKKLPNAILTYRQYLLDARFAVILDGRAEFLNAVAAALLNPVWGLWFGRKSCIPAMPVIRASVRGSEEEALADVGLTLDSAARLSAVRDAESFAAGTDTVMDVPVNFETRAFKPRRIDRRPAASG